MRLVLLVLAGPLLELVVGPAVLTGGWQAGEEAWPTAVRVLGAVLVVLGVAVVAWCVAVAARTRPGALLDRGPYAVVRHPMYVASAAAIAGQGLLLSRPVLLVAAGVYLVAMASISHLREEPQLRARHGADFDAYAARVGAWLPRR